MPLTEPVTGQPYTGPSYQNFAFTLRSPGNKFHLLTISKQIAEQVLEQAYITGTWQGESSPGTLMGTPKPIAGVITGNGNSIKRFSRLTRAPLGKSSRSDDNNRRVKVRGGSIATE
jgi:hypothetical protein